MHFTLPSAYSDVAVYRNVVCAFLFLCFSRVYVAYLDSVHFFRPRHFRTEVYHDILIGYLDYVKSVG